MGDLNAKVVKERKDNGWLGSDREPETSAAKKKKKKNVSSVVQQTIK